MLKVSGREAVYRFVPPLRFSRSEMSGAFGDVGTFVPLAVGLIALNGLHPAPVFLLAGLFYITSGLYYRVPMSVQPLKAFSALAIALGLAPSVISAGALLMGLILLTIALSGVMEPLARLFTKPIVRGIQLSVGLILLRSGWGLINQPSLLPQGSAATFELLGVNLPWGIPLACLAALVLALTWDNRRLPASVAVIVMGIILGIALAPHGWLSRLSFGPALPAPVLPAWNDYASAFLLLVLPQLPLTLGNAVVAACDTARGYFGEGAARVTYRALPLSMGLANLAAGLFGGAPLCHGAGGITAHYRFGARSAAAPIIIGSTLLFLGLLFPRSLLTLLGLLPSAVLGILLAVVGLQHALLACDVRQPFHILVTLVIAVVSLVTSNIALGFAAGLVIYYAGQSIKLATSFKALQARVPIRDERDKTGQ